MATALCCCLRRWRRCAPLSLSLPALNTCTVPLSRCASCVLAAPPASVDPLVRVAVLCAPVSYTHLRAHETEADL
eukprot:2523602-Rhodomonas_salina.1